MITDIRLSEMTHQVELNQSEREETPVNRPDCQPEVVTSQRIQNEQAVVVVGKVLSGQHHPNVECQKKSKQHQRQTGAPSCKLRPEHRQIHLSRYTWRSRCLLEYRGDIDYRHTKGSSPNCPEQMGMHGPEDPEDVQTRVHRGAITRCGLGDLT